MGEEGKLAFEYATKGIEHLITLATGIITLMITFGKDVFKNEPKSAKKSLFVGWLFFLASIFFGVFSYFKVAGTLAIAKPGEASIYQPGIMWLATAQILFFLLGTAFCVAFGIKCFTGGPDLSK